MKLLGIFILPNFYLEIFLLKLFISVILLNWPITITSIAASPNKFLNLLTAYLSL